MAIRPPVLRVFAHELVINLGKNDVWDWRVFALIEDAVMKHDDLICANGDVEKISSNKWLKGTNDLRKGHIEPSPKPVGFFGVLHPGLSDTSCKVREA